MAGIEDEEATRLEYEEEVSRPAVSESSVFIL